MSILLSTPSETSPQTAPETNSQSAPALMEPEEYLLAYLQTHDAACPLCRYNLRGIPRLRCPECGREIRLELTLAEPRIMPWVMTTLFVAMAASAGILFVSSVGFYGPHYIMAMLRERNWLLLAGAAYGVAATPLGLALLKHRRKFMQLSPRSQWTLAAAAFGINAFLVVYALLTHKIR
jgi:hypothetical protein